MILMLWFNGIRFLVLTFNKLITTFINKLIKNPLKLKITLVNVKLNTKNFFYQKNLQSTKPKNKFENSVNISILKVEIFLVNKLKKR